MRVYRKLLCPVLQDIITLQSSYRKYKLYRGLSCTTGYSYYNYNTSQPSRIFWDYNYNYTRNTSYIPDSQNDLFVRRDVYGKPFVSKLILCMRYFKWITEHRMHAECVPLFFIRCSILCFIRCSILNFIRCSILNFELCFIRCSILNSELRFIRCSILNFELCFIRRSILNFELCSQLYCSK